MNRNFELDILRGLSIALMIIVDAPPDVIYQTLQHSAWEGINLADTIFPAFVFVMGTSAALATARHKFSMQKIFQRAGILFCAGFLLNVLIFFCFDTEHIRLFGVLQRLALTYLLGMLILLNLKSTEKISAAAFFLLIISSLGFHIYAPENSFSEIKNISGAVDFIFPGVNHIYETTHDPEGLYGTLASTASMLFGFIAGKFLLQNERRKLILYGVGILISGYGWSFFDIVAKKIWTAPFALLNAGGDMILIAALGFLFEKLPLTKKIFHPFDSLGRNPLLFFVASNVAIIFLCAIQISGVPALFLLYQKTWQGIFSNELNITLFCVSWGILWMIPAEILNRRKIFIKL